MEKYRLLVTATYSDIMEVEATSMEEAIEIANEIPPSWVSFGNHAVAYLENCDAEEMGARL